MKSKTMDFLVKAFESISDECIEWPFCKDKKGYGRMHQFGERSAHRVSYKIFYGEIPKGLFICHKCDNQACINPKHLFLGTAKDNVQDMVKKGRGKGCFHNLMHNGKGSLNARSKLSESDVLEIRERFHKKQATQTAMAKEYGVSVTTINDAVLRRNWSHI